MSTFFTSGRWISFWSVDAFDRASGQSSLFTFSLDALACLFPAPQWKFSLLGTLCGPLYFGGIIAVLVLGERLWTRWTRGKWEGGKSSDFDSSKGRKSPGIIRNGPGALLIVAANSNLETNQWLLMLLMLLLTPATGGYGETVHLLQPIDDRGPSAIPTGSRGCCCGMARVYHNSIDRW